MKDDGGYRRMKLRAEVQCWAIWNLDNDDNVDPTALPISRQLADDINRWSDALDKSYDLSARNFHVELGSRKNFDIYSFNTVGWELFGRLKSEMPCSEWWYYDMLSSRLMQTRLEADE